MIYSAPVDWTAVYSIGAPSSVNKTYTYQVYTYGNGYDISCTYISGNYDRNVLVQKKYLKNETDYINPITVANVHAETIPNGLIYVPNTTDNYGNFITFMFTAQSSYNLTANGVISYHN